MLSPAIFLVLGLALAQLNNDLPEIHDLASATAAISAAWTGPHSCESDLCIFHNPIHNGGSVLVTPGEYGDVVASSFPPHTDFTASPEPFREAAILGKGRALLATRDIKAGEVLMSRSPTMLVHSDSHSDEPREVLEGLYEEALERLGGERRRHLERQYGKDIFERIDKNAFKMGLTGDEAGAHLGLYPDVARINHACRPNVAHRIVNTTITVTAAVDIPAGDELTLSYVDIRQPTAFRAERLLSWGIKCTCPLCSATAAEQAASDARLAAIAELESRLDDPSAEGVKADDGARLIRLSEEEGLHVSLGKSYARAALNFALTGEPERAKEYAATAVDVLVREFGEENGDVKGMRILAKDPEEHWSWGVRRLGFGSAEEENGSEAEKVDEEEIAEGDDAGEALGEDGLPLANIFG